MTLLHMIPHRAGLSIDPLHISFPCPAHMNTTVHFIGLGETCCRPASQVCHTYILLSVINTSIILHCSILYKNFMY
jgi:hypothetical protein